MNIVGSSILTWSLDCKVLVFLILNETNEIVQLDLNLEFGLQSYGVF